MDDTRINWILENRSKYYEVLQVPKDADERTIRRSYHSLVLQLHPDKNPNNPRAREAFCAVARSYEVLMDGKLRYVYDTHGEEVLNRWESSELFSLSEVALRLVHCASAKVLYHAACRIHATETLCEKFSWTEPFLPQGHNDMFEIRFKVKRRASRRLGERNFLVVLLMFILATLKTPVLDAWERYGRIEGTGGNTYSSLAGSGRDGDVGATFVYSAATEGGVKGVTVWRPSTVSEAIARKLVQQWIEEVCPVELLLAWASRERYEVTATIRVRRGLKAVKAPDRPAKRKWPRKLWSPKFNDTFSVTSADQLFVSSSLCVLTD
ncbi:chaperone protein DNAj, putative [Trypanosoma brucei gambiense DAL972]|uniref:Chaperone protein DNAj, putative n=1 Tax=Trypanosoma brucei gambiense (strain MHOM/CI/86/DAL972) TaxID=679716 RepID=C9ZZG4_TRYB9|nr:chaperone protein DNAj, putative [Trypanosoma brucei gambiense DAL972]CBH14813.1 chaperone protein DNAj, putative [Trypanosoma brucei gambiense DAL972]|eukprot:XP_011777079.1 chaperone protein DNAj, putative [Trypanosoma brucei gambiense DAL972]